MKGRVWKIAVAVLMVATACGDDDVSRPEWYTKVDPETGVEVRCNRYTDFCYRVDD